MKSVAAPKIADVFPGKRMSAAARRSVWLAALILVISAFVCLGQGFHKLVSVPLSTISSPANSAAIEKADESGIMAVERLMGVGCGCLLAFGGLLTALWIDERRRDRRNF